MPFRSAMCPNCGANVKIENNSEDELIFCPHCGLQVKAKDAFMYHDIKMGGEGDIDGVENTRLLLKCGMDFLETKKYDLADSCFANILKNMPDDYQIWKLRAAAWESRVVNEYHKSFYEYSKKDGIVENKEYLGKYKEYCDNVLRYCPNDRADGLSEEFNDHIRGHFNIAYGAYKTNKRKTNTITVLTAAAMLGLAALALASCRI